MKPRIVFLGSKALGLRVLAAVREADAGEVVGVVTLDDSGDRRSALARFRAEVLAGLRVVKDGTGAASVIRDLHPDLVVVSGWYALISEDLLGSVPRGFVGLHGSALPAYRGHAPIVWQMIQGCPSVGLSLFQFGAGIDDGPIWAQARIPVGPDDYIADVLAKIEDAAAEMIRGNLRAVLGGIDWAQPQGAAGASYCGMRTPSDGKIDWRWPAEQIHDFIRAQSDPYPGAYTTLDGDRVIIWRAQPAEGISYGTPGQVVRLETGRAIVACGEGTALRLEKTERADWSFAAPPPGLLRPAGGPFTTRTRLG